MEGAACGASLFGRQRSSIRNRYFLAEGPTVTTTWQNLLRGGIVASLVAMSAGLLAAERRDAKAGTDIDAASAVDVFAAMEAQDIEVKIIPKDATEARLFVTNKTKKPLTVRMPPAFAAVPVLKQAVGGGGGRGGGSSSTQSMGGGMGGGMMGGGMMGGMMSIPPEKVAKLRFPTVCLEHGKKDPRPGIPYELKPLETVTSEPGVKEVVMALGTKGMSQRAAQAAVWHLANGLSWQQLATKRIEHLDGTSESWFHPNEIRAGVQIANVAVRVAAAKEKTSKSPGGTASLNKAFEAAKED